MPRTLGPDGPVEGRHITMYSRQWATVESYAKDQGFNVSLALRRIIDEWVELKARMLVDTTTTYTVKND